MKILAPLLFASTCLFASPTFSEALDTENRGVTSRNGVTLAEVPLTGPVVVGSAALHEHVMAEHAFSGKWHWGSVDGPEDKALGICDGNGHTHAGAMGACNGLAYIFAKDVFGRDTCCHSGGVLDCNYKATNGKDPNNDEKWDFLDWPIWDTHAHPRYWHGQLRKALKAGLKLMLVHAVENYALCSLVSQGTTEGHPIRGAGYHCDHGDSFNSIKRQIDALKTFVANHSKFMQIAYSPRDARAIIQDKKMAVVIGVEADYAWGNEKQPIDLLQRLNDYYALGARSILLAHQLNTRLAGSAQYYPNLWVQQSFANCLFSDRQCADPNPSVPSDPGHSYEIRQSWCLLYFAPRYAKNYGQMCPFSLLSRAGGSSTWDGFDSYPGARVYMHDEENYEGYPVTVRKNGLGLTSEGKSVVRAMMKKGMLVDITHVSEKAIADIYDISQQNRNYPLIASHGYARRMLFDKEKKTRVAGKTYAFAGWEFPLGDDTLEKIKNSEGILGHFIAPDPVLTYHGSKVENNCPRSTRSLAQLITYVVDKGVRVAWAGDFMGMGEGVAPRRGYSDNENDWCGGDATYQNAQGNRVSADLSKYFGDEAKDRAYFDTRGFGHFGLLQAFHEDLIEIGLRWDVLTEFKDRAAENFIRTWEKSEYIAASL